MLSDCAKCWKLVQRGVGDDVDEVWDSEEEG